MNIVWLISYYIICGGGYFYFSHQPTDNHFMTSLENFFPTMPIFIIPYLLATLAFIFVPLYFYFRLDFAKTRMYLVTQIIASLISYVVFFIYPTSVLREPINGNGVFDNALRWLYSTDRPSAAFPSGHVFQSIIIAYFFWQYFPETRPFIIILLPIVIASTVLLKQHYLPDIPGGLAVALIAIIISKYSLPKESKSQI